MPAPEAAETACGFQKPGEQGITALGISLAKMIEEKGFDEFGNVGGWQENVAIGDNGDLQI